MKKKYRDQWLKDLRSGEFKQGRGALCKTRGEVTTYCCLGVLGSQVGTFEADSKDVACRNALRLPGFQPCNSPRTLLGILDFQLLIQLGLTHPEQSELIRLNDTLRISFSEIANHIEKHIPEESDDVQS